MAMNDAEVERQIDQMVRFIKQEAQEKANEIAVSAEEVYHSLLQLCIAEQCLMPSRHPLPLPLVLAAEILLSPLPSCSCPACLMLCASLICRWHVCA